MINKYNILKGILQNYLEFISTNKHIKFFSDSQEIYLWKSKGMSEEIIKNLPGSKDTFPLGLINSYPLSDIKLKRNCLINSNIAVFWKAIDLYISYALDTWSRDLDTDFTLGSCLFGAVKLTKNIDTDIYGYSGYGIGFDARSQFSWTESSWRKIVAVFGFHDSSSVHVGNKKKNILILGEGPTQGLNDTTKLTEAINFRQSRKRFVLSMHYNGSNSFLFLNAVKMCQFKAKDTEIKSYPLCLGNNSNDFTIDNIKKTLLKGSA